MFGLAGGRFAGKSIYVAEHIGSVLKPATASTPAIRSRPPTPGPTGPSGGSAKGLDTPSVPWSQCGCTEQDNVDPGGQAFARFLRTLARKHCRRQQSRPASEWRSESCSPPSSSRRFWSQPHRADRKALLVAKPDRRRLGAQSARATTGAQASRPQRIGLTTPH